MANATSTAPPLSMLPLVGREAELAVLHAVLDDVEAGRGRTVLVRGEAGVGKTRLVRWAADAATRRGWTVAVGQAYLVETGVPYAPLADALLPTLRASRA